ncbi:MAG: D-inositol-3-phosphate glycosyltransferase [Chloroflexota bacterium]|nr:D-inositol-3-phosphate glycosyltransferase [Chloroflexota bacterium]
MNIAMLSYHTCPLATLGGKDTGGMNVYVRDLTRYLGQMGVHVDVFTRSQDEHVPHVLHDLGCGNRVVHVPAGPECPRPKTELTRYIPQFVSGINEFAASKGIRYDLIHSHYWLSGLAAHELAESWHTPIIHMFHTLALLKNQIAKTPEELESEIRIEGEREVIRIADKIVAATADEVDHLRNLYDAPEDKIEVIPPGVDTTRFYPIPEDEAKEFIGIPKDERMLLYVGRIEPLKGIDILIRAIARLKQSDVLSNCPHYLYIIGGEPEAEEGLMNREMQRLQDLCQELGVNDLVLFLGKRDQDTLQYYYSAAEIVIMPSHYESFGMVALEAMACGTPVIATQVGGLQHLVQNGKTGFTIPNDNVDVLEQSLTKLICKEGLREEMSRNSVVYARSYAWDVITPRIIDLYLNMVESYESFQER